MCLRKLPPACSQTLHVGRQFGSKVHLLPRQRVLKAQRAGMERLARTGLKAMLHKLPVGSRHIAAQNLVAAVAASLNSG